MLSFTIIHLLIFICLKGIQSFTVVVFVFSLSFLMSICYWISDSKSIDVMKVVNAPRYFAMRSLLEVGQVPPHCCTACFKTSLWVSRMLH
jgi:hypothetical protein